MWNNAIKCAATSPVTKKYQKEIGLKKINMFRQKDQTKRETDRGVDAAVHAAVASDPTAELKKDSSEFHESAGGLREKVCVCSNYNSQTDRQRDKEREKGVRQTDSYIYIDITVIFFLLYTVTSQKKKKMQTAVTCQIPCPSGSMACWPFPDSPHSHFPPWSSSWKVATLKGGAEGLSRYRPWTWHNTICHTQQAYRVGEGSCLERNNVNVTGESAVACSPEVLFYSTVNQFRTIQYTLLTSSQWTKHKSGATFCYLYWF